MMTKVQERALKNVQSILQRNFHQSLVSVVFADQQDGMKVKIHTMDGTANDTQAEHLARASLQNIEVMTRGLIVTTFDTGVVIKHTDHKPKSPIKVYHEARQASP